MMELIPIILKDDYNPQVLLIYPHYIDLVALGKDVDGCDQLKLLDAGGTIHVFYFRPGSRRGKRYYHTIMELTHGNASYTARFN